jgi:mannitol/fructose-specific phosphotransferase system IIA component (Ntr-type)
MESAPFTSLFETRRIFLDLKGGSMAEILRELSERLQAGGDIRDAEELTRRLIEREKLGCTGLGNGLAIPHCKLGGLEGVLLAIGISRDGVDFHSLDGRPVRLIFLVLSPAESPAGHLQALARISRLVKTPGVTEAILSATSTEQVSLILREAEGRLSGA